MQYFFRTFSQELNPKAIERQFPYPVSCSHATFQINLWRRCAEARKTAKKRRVISFSDLFHMEISHVSSHVL
jgi:hypothetical protein